MNNWKNSLSCWFFVYDILHRVLAFCLCMSRFYFSKSSSLFIEDLRDVENLAVTSTCLALKLWFFTLDLLPDLIVVLWRANFKSIPLQKEQRLQQCYCYPCLDVETKIAEMVVAELVVVHFVHCPLSTLVKLLLVRCFWWPLLLMTLLLMTYLQELFFRRVSSDALLQTHFFRCILPDAYKLQIKFHCSWTCSIRIFMNSTLIMDPVHLNKLFSISNWWFLIHCYYQNLRGDFEKHPLFQQIQDIMKSSRAISCLLNDFPLHFSCSRSLKSIPDLWSLQHIFLLNLSTHWF